MASGIVLSLSMLTVIMDEIAEASNLTEEDVDEISEKINREMAEKFLGETE